MEARGHQTQWAAQFAVASELCKRGYEVAFTSGHTTPIADLMVVSPKEKKMFLVDVKDLYRRNPWLIKRKPLRDNLFYVLGRCLSPSLSHDRRADIQIIWMVFAQGSGELRRACRSKNHPGRLRGGPAR
jgi:hypothetical protein